MTAKTLLIVALVAHILGNIFSVVGEVTDDSASCLVLILAIVAQLISLTAIYKILILVFVSLGI